MSASKFHRNHSKHISISERLSEELKKTEQDILIQLNNVNQKKGADQLLIKVINQAVRGIFGIIPDLQEIVIKNNTKGENNDDIKDIIKKVNQSCNEMVQEYDSNSSTLIQKFKIFIQNILLQAEALLNIIKKDSHHDFKHELVENLKEILYTIQTSEVRMRLDNYSKQELKNLVDSIQKEYVENISKMENFSLEDVLKTMHSIVKYNAQHVFKIAYQLNKVASNFTDIDIQHKILDAAKLVNARATTALLNHDEFTNTKQAVTVLADWCVNSWNAVNSVFDFMDNFDNKKSSENLKDITKYVIAYGFVINIHIGRSIKSDSLFA